MAATLEELKRTIEELRREYQNLTGKPAALFDIRNIDDANAAVRTLEGSIDNAIREADKLQSGFGGVYSEIQSILSELNKSENATNKVTKAFRGVERIARDLKDDQQGFNRLTIDELKTRQKKLKSQAEEARVQSNIVKSRYEGTAALETGLLRGRDGKLLNESALKVRARNLGVTVEQLKADAEIVGQQEEGLRVIEETNAKLEERIQKEQRINESLGLGGAILGSMKGALDKLGMGGLADKLGFDEAQDAMRELTEELTNGGETTLDFAGKTKVLGAGFKNMGANLMKNLKDPLSIGLMIVGQLVDALGKVDKSTGEVAKNLGMSYDQANAMVSDMTAIANLSGDTHVNTENLVKAQLELSKALGTNVMLNKELLVDFAKLTEQAGYSVETMTALGKITQSTGGDLSDNTAEILGTAKAFNAVNKLALNEKDIVAEVAKTGAATVLTFGRSADALAKNVMQAKQFGLNLQQAEAISSSLLNFQSSIESEMEAELLTGKQLNLEQARMLALQGKTGEAAAEVAKQFGTAEEFGKMNVMQQEALAKSVGMSRDDLAQSLIEREALVKVGMQDLSTQEAYNELKKQGLSDDEIAVKLGNKQLANQMKSESVQERFAAATQKLQEVFVSIAEPILAIVSPLMDLVTAVLPAINILLMPITSTFKFLGESISFFVGGIKEAFSYLSFIGDLVSPIVEYFKELKTNNEGLLEVFNVIGGVLKFVVGMLGSALAIDKARLVITTLTNKEKLAGLASNAKELLFGKKSIISLIAKAAMTAFSSLATIPIVGPVLGIAAAAGAAALGYKYLSKADDIMSPGYGKRILSAPEGTFALNDKDTVVAGTDLDQGSEQSSPTSTPSINLAPLVEQMSQMNSTLQAILAKEGTVTLDGTKVGTALTVANSKLQ